MEQYRRIQQDEAAEVKVKCLLLMMHSKIENSSVVVSKLNKDREQVKRRCKKPQREKKEKKRR